MNFTQNKNRCQNMQKNRQHRESQDFNLKKSIEIQKSGERSGS